jgi:hypothetical protein
MSCCCLPADAVIGVSLFADEAPESLGAFSLAFVALFRVAAGETSVTLTPLSPLPCSLGVTALTMLGILLDAEC